MGCPAPQRIFSALVPRPRPPAHRMVGEVPHPTTLGTATWRQPRSGSQSMNQITGAVAPVLIVEPLSPSRPGWERYALPNELSGGLIKTDRRSDLGVVGLLIQPRHPPWPLQTLRSPLECTTPPVARASARFFEHPWRTVSGEMDGAKPNSTTFPAKRRSVQRPRPSGGVLHATAISMGFLAVPLSYPSLSRSRLFPRACSSPSSTRRLRILPTVAVATSGRAAAIAPSEFPSLPSRCRTRALVTMGNGSALPPR